MKNIVCVFAHPDDEAFGPGGTIAKFAKKSNVYILCATKGEAGQNSLKEKRKLGEIRADELKRSAKILGVKKVYFLRFEDGTLSNNQYHKLASKIRSKLLKLKPEIVLTYEPHGVSGHIDHITVAMVVMHTVQKLKFVKTVMQFCRPFGYKSPKDYFIYFPPGYKKRDIDLRINTKDVWKKKVEAMNQHKSQSEDIKRVLKIQKKLPKEEHFLVIKK